MQSEEHPAKLSPPGVPWRPSGALAAITLVAAASRVALLGQVMRHDEAVTFTRFSRSIEAALTDYSAPNNHILHSILVRLSTDTFGSEPWAIRLPAFLFGVLLVVAVHWWVSSAVHKEAGLVAAALVAGSYFLIEYSTIARGYTMVAVGFVVLLEMTRRILAEGGTSKRWAVWIVIAVFGFTTVPVFAYPFTTVVTWMAFSVVLNRAADSRRRLGVLLASATAAVGLLTVLAYLPAAAATGVAAIVDNDFVQPISRNDLLDEWRRLSEALVGLFAKDGWVALSYPPLVAIAVADSRRAFGRLVNPASGLVGVGLVMAAQAVSPPTRVFLFAWPLVLALVGIGFHLLSSRIRWLLRHPWSVPLLAIALAGFMALNVVASGEVLESREAGTFRDGPAAADVLVDILVENDRIVVESHPRPVLEYYLHRGGWGGPQLQRDYDNAQRLFVIVYHPRPQDLGGVLESVPTSEFTEPRLLRQLPETDVYVMERLPGSE